MEKRGEKIKGQQADAQRGGMEAVISRPLNGGRAPHTEVPMACAGAARRMAARALCGLFISQQPWQKAVHVRRLHNALQIHAVRAVFLRQHLSLIHI